MLRKKWLSFLVAVSMVTAMLPTTAFAEGDAVQVGSMTTVVETATGENEQQNTEGETSEEEKSEGETPDEGEKSDDETPEEEKPNDDKSEGEVSEEEKAEGETNEGETNEDKTPAETPVTPAANSIMLMNETGEGEAGEAAEPQSLSATPETFESVLASANTGANISLAEGTYNIGNQQINKAVSFFGAGMDKTIIVGSLTYAYEGGGNVNVKNLTLQAPEDNTTVEQAINLKKADGTVLTVENCKIADYLFGIGVNSEAKNCKLKANLTLDNVWCGVSVKGGDANNTLTNFTVAEGSTVDYATQDWGTEDGVTYDKGYCETNGSEPVQATKPNLANGEWPAPVTMNGKHYASLQAAVNAIEEGTSGNIDLNANIELDETVWVPAGADVYIVGDDFDIKLPDGDNAAAFSAKPGDGYLEGLRPDTRLTVNGANFVGYDTDSVGYAAIVSNGGGVVVGFESCSFKNMFTTMLSQAITDPNAETSFLTIAASCTFENVDYLYSVDDGATEGALTDKWNYTMVNPGENAPKPETFAVAVVNGKGYDDLQKAVDALSPDGGTIELKKDVTLTAPINVPVKDITIEGNGYTITLPKTGFHSAFNNTTGLEGLKVGTDLNVNNVKFVGDVDNTKSGHAVVIGFEGGVDVNMANCTFENLYDAVYANPVANASADPSSIVISGEFENVKYSYSLDNVGGRIDKYSQISVSAINGSSVPAPPELGRRCGQQRGLCHAGRGAESCRYRWQRCGRSASAGRAV